MTFWPRHYPKFGFHQSNLSGETKCKVGHISGFTLDRALVRYNFKGDDHRPPPAPIVNLLTNEISTFWVASLNIGGIKLIRDLYPLAPPASWTIFEDLCLQFARARWRNHGAQKNGREGQPQHGVDIFGRDNRRKLYCGVQCKGKRNFPGGMISESELRAEVGKASKFHPPIDVFILSAAVLRDSKLQEAAREISKENKKHKKFLVEIWSWEDIRSDLYDHPEIIRSFYPGYLADRNLSRLVRCQDRSCRIDLYGTDALGKIASSIGELGDEIPVNREFWLLLRTVLIELAANAFDHGTAARADVEVSSSGVTITDDGGRFNPLTADPSVSVGVGLKALHIFRELMSEQVEVFYNFSKNNNKLSFKFLRPALRNDSRQKIFTIEGDTISEGRSSVQGKFIIPPDVDDVVINMTNGPYALSTAMALLEEVERQVEPGQKVTVLTPKHLSGFMETIAVPRGIKIQNI